MNNVAQRLDAAIKVCDRHAHWLGVALDDLASTMPLSAAALDRADAGIVRTLDQFVYRFGKLQDAMGNQLFVALLTVLEEPHQDWSMRDRLHRLEQLTILSDLGGWDRIRAVRNRLVNEYPDAPERRAAVLKLAWQLAPSLLASAAEVLRVARRESQRMRGEPAR